MPEILNIEEQILDTTSANHPTHKTHIRRQLDQQYEVTITYTVLEAYLDELCKKGLLTSDNTSNYYTPTTDRPKSTQETIAA